MKKRLFCSAALMIVCLYAAKAQSGVTDTMGYYRAQIDTLDKQIIDLIGQRTGAARAIGIYKMDHNIGVVQQDRFKEVLKDAIQRGRDNQLSEKFIRNLFDDIHEESIRQEKALKPKR